MTASNIIAVSEYLNRYLLLVNIILNQSTDVFRNPVKILLLSYHNHPGYSEKDMRRR